MVDMDSKGSFVNWLELPEHIVELIIKNLNLIDDFIRFSAVCQLWYSLSRKNRHILPRQIPLLMISNENSSVLNALSFDMKKSYNFSVQIPPNYHCIGSTEGWLVMEADYNHRSLHLLQPFLFPNKRIDLSLLTIGSIDDDPRVYKLVLSEDPTSTHDFVAMAIICRLKGIGRCLAFCRSGDKAWTEVDRQLFFQDVIYYKHQFYAVDQWGRVFACDISTSNPVLTIAAPSPQCNRNMLRKLYLVESSGELWQIHRKYQRARSSAVDMNLVLMTTGFEIYKLDPIKLEWSEVKSLNDHLLVLGCQSSMSLSTSHFIGCDCNYVCFSEYRNPLVSNGHCDDAGFFNFKEGSIEKLSLQRKQMLLWIEPKLYQI